MERQRYFFEILKTKIPDQYRLVDIIEEALQMSTDSVYRRIRGEKELSFSELYTLCTKFNISLDEIFSYKSGQSAMFKYMPVNFSDQNSYILYIKKLLESFTVFKSFKTDQEKELYLTAQDIPFYHFGDYPELLYFKLYVWNDTINRIPISYMDFCNILDIDTILPIHKQITSVFHDIPSKEIWTNQTIDTILRLLEHYYEIGAFDKKETALFLLNQLTNMMDNIKKYADDGYKSENTKNPIYIYLCSVDMECNRILLKMGDNMSCSIRLYTVNSITTENKTLCLETLKWIDDLISKSILISGTSIKERVRFFQSSKNKIDGLINKIEMSR